MSRAARQFPREVWPVAQRKLRALDLATQLADLTIPAGNRLELLRRIEDERRSLVIEKRGTPKAVLLSFRDYVRLATPEPEVLRAIGEESQTKGTDKLTSRQIEKAIRMARGHKPKRG